MQIDELIRRVGVDNVGVQVLHESITGARQRKGYVDVSFGTDCVSMRDIATGQWENVVFVVSVKRAAFELARDASLSTAADADAPALPDDLVGVPCAVRLDRKHSRHGWLYIPHADGQWVPAARLDDFSIAIIEGDASPSANVAQGAEDERAAFEALWHKARNAWLVASRLSTQEEADAAAIAVLALGASQGAKQ